MLSKDLKEFMDENISSRAKFGLYSLFIDISTSLRSLRKTRGITQEELAKNSNTSYSAIARWEQPGYSGYSLSKLVEIANALNADVKLSIVPRESLMLFAPFTANERVSQDWGNEFTKVPSLYEKELKGALSF